VTDQNHFVNLLNLDQTELGRLQIVLIHQLANDLVEQRVVRWRQIDTREEIGDDTVEKGHIVRQELGDVDIDNGAQHQHAFLLVGLLQLQVSCCCQYSLDSTHTVIIMVLRGQLFGTKFVSCDNFLRQ